MSAFPKIGTIMCHLYNLYNSIIDTFFPFHPPTKHS